MKILSVFRTISAIPFDENLTVATLAISVRNPKAVFRSEPSFSVTSGIVEREREREKKRAGGKAMELPRFQHIKSWLTRWFMNWVPVMVFGLL
jgi:hypothetical protein